MGDAGLRLQGNVEDDGLGRESGVGHFCGMAMVEIAGEFEAAEEEAPEPETEDAEERVIRLGGMVGAEPFCRIVLNGGFRPKKKKKMQINRKKERGRKRSQRA